MISRGWRRTLLAVAMMLAVTFPSGVKAKFRDAVHFEDNRFVDIGNFELLHRFQRVTGTDPNGMLDRTELRYQLTYGVMKNFETGLRVPVILFDNGQEGVGDVSLIQRFKFTERRYDFPETSGGFEIGFPTGDENAAPPTGTDSLSVRLFAAAGDDFAPGWAWLVHGAATFFGDNAVDDEYEYNAALRYRSHPGVKWNLELNGSTGGLYDLSETYLSPGMLLHSRRGVSVSLSVPFGLSGDAADQKATLQVSHEF